MHENERAKMDIDGYISQEIMTSISSYPANFLPVITHIFPYGCFTEFKNMKRSNILN